MPRMTSLETEYITAEFVKDAADYFSDHPEARTYTNGEILPGVVFAVRWGLGDDCILVFELGDMEPVIYQNCIIKSIVPEHPAPVLTFDDDIPF